MEEKKTHRLHEKPSMSVRFLADYMAASDQARRTILRGCKYRTIARLVQHDDAKLAVATFMLGGTNDPGALTAEADYIRNKLADSDFDRDSNDINADYVARFAEVVADVEPLPGGAEWQPSKPFAAQTINGVRITFAPNLLTRRVTKKNTVRTGALMLRYKKDTKLSSEVGAYQSAAIHGLLSLYGVDTDEEVDKALCLTLDAQSGRMHPAPTNAVSRFNNTKAACATIAEAWENIKPPPGAVI